jgi:Xaa-Pro aminopeptidase
MDSIKIHDVQQRLKAAKLDGWLLYDFRRNNDIAVKLLEIPPERILTRRFFYWIPQQGDPVKILHQIEPGVLSHLPGELQTYATWQDLESSLRRALQNAHTVAMEYSPKNNLPYVSRVDAGTFEFISSWGVQIHSSADLIAAPLSSAEIESHLEAADFLDTTASLVWKWIAAKLRRGEPLTEWDVQNYILEEMEVHGFGAEEGVICAVNAHSADPHYHAQQGSCFSIQADDLILIDMACRKKGSNTIYADITRIASARPSQRQKSIFDVVRAAQKTATSLVEQRIAVGKPMAGYEVDDAARNVIREAGYGSFFIHRTGHNLGLQVHGPGTHMDNYETHDDRLICPNTCFTIEPGIYLPGEFGVRLEYDLLIFNGKVRVTGGTQEAITLLEID